MRSRHSWRRRGDGRPAPGPRLSPPFDRAAGAVFPWWHAAWTGNQEESVGMKETIGFIGLGGMGMAMATNLLKAGFRLRVYNRTLEKGRRLLERGALLALSPAETAEPGGIVVTMVSDDRAVEEVTLGSNGFLGRLGDGV